MSRPLHPAQPGAAMPSPFSDEALLALLEHSMTPYQWIKLASVNGRILRVVTAILQKPVPALFHIQDGSLKLMEVDLRNPVICGRSSLSAHVFPSKVLPHVSARTCRLLMQSTGPMQFLLEPTNPLNGVLYSEHGGPWKHTLTQPVTLGLSDRFSLDVQCPDAHGAIFQLGCLRPLNLVGLLASTQPIDDLDLSQVPTEVDVPDCLFELLNDDLTSAIFAHLLPRIPPKTNPRALLAMLPFLKLRGVSELWQTLLAPQQLDFKTRMSVAIVGLGWAVFPNDPHDGTGVLGVWQAAHSRGKGERMVAAGFPTLSTPQQLSLLQKPCIDVFRFKKGGTKLQARQDAWSTLDKLLRHVEGYEDHDGDRVEGHGNDTVVWGCGGGSDRCFVQCSMASPEGWIDPDNMRPLNGKETPSMWDQLCFRKSLDWEQSCLNNRGRCSSINLASSANGTGTYLSELWRGGQLVHTFMIGIYPHPGSQSWGDVEDRVQQQAKFLRDLAFGTPSQMHVIRINADDFD